MKSYSHLWERITSPDNIKLAIDKASKGKRSRKRVKEIYENKEKYIDYFQSFAAIYKHRHKKPKIIKDGACKKEREIVVPSFDEQVLHHMIVNVISPIITHGMYEHAHGSIPGRGPQKAAKQIKKWIARDGKHCKYYLKMDIRHFFGSIDHDRLKAYIKRYIRDERALRLIFEVIDCTDKGLPLGFHTSHWLANWYLQGLDHYIKQDLKAEHYVRYMDDMVIFGSNKKKLHRIRVEVAGYLNDRLGLELKPNWQVARFHHRKGGRFLDFMGFRFYRDRTTLRRSIMLRMTRRARRISRKEKPTIYDCRRMMSALGWLKATDTYGMYLKWIKPCISFRKMKKRISRHDRKERRKLCMYMLKAA